MALRIKQNLIYAGKRKLFFSPYESSCFEGGAIVPTLILHNLLKWNVYQLTKRCCKVKTRTQNSIMNWLTVERILTITEKCYSLRESPLFRFASRRATRERTSEEWRRGGPFLSFLAPSSRVPFCVPIARDSLNIPQMESFNTCRSRFSSL